MRGGWFRWVPPALLAAGAVLIGLAVYQGTAHVSLIVIIPLVTGTSALFLGGVLLVAAGFVLLPVALGLGFSEEDDEETPAPNDQSRARAEMETESAAGGILLVGPIPILFGKWGRRTPWTYLTFALVGLALTLVAVFLVLFV